MHYQDHAGNAHSVSMFSMIGLHYSAFNAKVFTVHIMRVLGAGVILILIVVITWFVVIVISVVNITG